MNSLNLISGAKSRAYRKEIAKFSEVKKGNENSVLTLKFKLDSCEQVLNNQGIEFSDFKYLYNIVEGVDKGSLTHFLFSIVLSGFHLFSNASFAIDFYNEQEVVYELWNKNRIRLRSLSSQEISTLLKGNDKSSDDFVNYLIFLLLDEKGSDSNAVNDFKRFLTKTINDCMASDSELKNDKSELLVKIFGRIKEHYCKDAPTCTDNEFFPESSSIAFDKMTSLNSNIPSIFMPYIVVSKLLSRIPLFNDEVNEKHMPDAKVWVKDNLLTHHNNALSWLFNKGLGIFRDNDVPELVKIFNIPESKIDAIKSVKTSADAISQNLLKCNANFEKILGLHKFRSNFGGHIQSWVSNYITRLTEIKNLLCNFKQDLKIPNCFIKDDDDFIKYCDCNRKEIQFLLESIYSSETQVCVKQAVDHLLGIGGEAKSEDVELILNFSELLNRLGAIKEQIENVLNQCEEDKNSIWHDLKNHSKDEWKNWLSFKTMNKLNGLSGGVPDVEFQLYKKLELSNILRNEQQLIYKRVQEWIVSQNPNYSPFTNLMTEEENNAKKRREKGFKIEEQPIRKLLEKIGRVANKSSDQVSSMIIEWFKDQCIFKKSKDFNQYFCNKKGKIYKSIFSTNNNKPYALADDISSRNSEIWDSLLFLLERVNELSFRDYSSAVTQLNLVTTLQSFYIQGVKKDIPSNIIKLNIPSDLFNGEDPVSASMKLKLKREKIDSSVVNSILSLYKSLITGCYTQLKREKFFLRTKFTWTDNHDLIYVPKSEAWKIPKRYFSSDLWYKYKEQGILVFTDDSNVFVDVEKTFEKVLDNMYKVDCSVLLMQLPHDWMYKLPVKSKKSKRDLDVVLSLSKDNKNLYQLKSVAVDLDNCVRLIGNSVYKNTLDKIMLSANSVTMGEFTLLIDQPVNQVIDSEGRIQLEYDDFIASLAIPITSSSVQSKDTGNQDYPFENIVAIDQGEAGIAYSVFSLKDAGNDKALPIESGTIRIPSIKKLIKSVNTFRKKKSVVQKFNQRFDSSMFNMRENVVGDVCGAIVGLMHAYKAFPVLEREVKNLESGSKQLLLVYKAVNARFLYGDVDMQNSEREAWWYTHGHWKTNYLKEVYSNKNNSNKRAKDIREINGKFYSPLNLFPGASVSAYMTSRICSCCGNNIFELLKKDSENGVKQYVVDENGETTVSGKRIQLYCRPSGKSFAEGLKKKKTYNALNIRAPWTVPIKAETYSIDELKKRIKENYRRAPKSLMSKDTSQSRFYCVFTECSNHNREVHADVNASINIGRRFLGSIIFNDSKKRI